MRKSASHPFAVSTSVSFCTSQPNFAKATAAGTVVAADPLKRKINNRNEEDLDVPVEGSTQDDRPDGDGQPYAQIGPKRQKVGLPEDIAGLEALLKGSKPLTRRLNGRLLITIPRKLLRRDALHI